MLTPLRQIEVLRRNVKIGRVLTNSEPLHIAVTLFLPPAGRLDARTTVLYCLPGGGVTRDYFDLAGEQYSFARALAAQGFVVAAFDPIGVGDSARPEDGFALTSEMVMRCHAAATDKLTALLREGAVSAHLPPLDVFKVGVGHSLGAQITILQQVERRDFAALILLCFGTIGMPEVLNEEELTALKSPDRGRSRLVELARKRFDGDAYAPIQRPAGRSSASRALAAVQDCVLAVASMQAIMPGNVAPEAAQLDMPLFLGVGEKDIVGPPHTLPAEYPACRDITLHIVPEAGHHPFVAPGATALFDRIGGWLRAIAPTVDYDGG